MYAKAAAEVTVSSLIEYFENVRLSEFLKRNPDRQTCDLVGYLQRAIIALSKQLHCADLRQFSATVLLTVCDGEDVLIFHLGDGTIFLQDIEGHICYVSEPENVSGMLNATYFSVSSDAADHARICFFKVRGMQIGSVLMMSDGPYLMFYNRGMRQPDRTAAEILGYVRDGIINSNEDLADIMNQMAEVPGERMDDWSVIVSDFQPSGESSEPRIISMLEEEREKNFRQ